MSRRKRRALLEALYRALRRYEERGPGPSSGVTVSVGRLSPDLAAIYLTMESELGLSRTEPNAGASP